MIREKQQKKIEIIKKYYRNNIISKEYFYIIEKVKLQKKL